MQLLRSLCIFALVALLASLLPGLIPMRASAQSSLTVHNLNTGFSYATIKEALDDNSTLDRHVIQVDSRVYHERVVLSKALSIIGENPQNTIIDGQGNGTVIDVLASNVTVRGFTIRNGGSVSGTAGVRAYGSSFCNVSGNIIDGNWFGIWLQLCDNPTVSDNNFTGNQNAIYVDSTTNSSISNNSFSGNDFAVWLIGAGGMDFQSNNISGNDYAVWIAQSANVSLVDNRIVDNSDGILVYNNSSSIKLTGNTISSNKDHAILLNDCSNSSVSGNHVSSKEMEAIYLQSSHGNSLKNNIVLGNGHDGIYLYQSENSVVDGNLVTAAKSAIVIYSSVDNVVSGNDLFGNHQGIQLSISRNTEVKENNVTRSANEGIYLALSSGSRLLNNSVSESGKAIVFKNSSNNLVDSNHVSKCGDGIRLEGSSGNSVSDNTFSLNDGCGLILSASSNNTVSNNDVLNNTAGIRLELSGNNSVYSNDVADNMRGIDVEQSTGDFLTRNDVLRNSVGVLLSVSNNETFVENSLSGNNVGLVLNLSDRNQIYKNVLTGNRDGVKLLYAQNNTFELNSASSNSGMGIYVLYSDFNFFLHNSLFNNSLAPASVNSSNRWDDGVEGNFWGYHGFVDADRNGIADTPFGLGDSERDNFPLMAEYAEFNARIDNVQYIFGIVCNSSISDFGYFRTLENSTELISFRIGTSQGLGFCRMTVPNSSIRPPFDVTVDNAQPLYQNVVDSNGTHSWFYFSYPYFGGAVRIVNAAPTPPFWTQLWFWGIVALAIAVGILAFAVYAFYRRLGSYKRTIEDVERRLREREQSSLEAARRLFGADVQRRSVKIGKFEEKYGIKIRPRDSLDDIFKALEKKERKMKENDEVNS